MKKKSINILFKLYCIIMGALSAIPSYFFTEFKNVLKLVPIGIAFYLVTRIIFWIIRKIYSKKNDYEFDEDYAVITLWWYFPSAIICLIISQMIIYDLGIFDAMIQSLVFSVLMYLIPVLINTNGEGGKTEFSSNNNNSDMKIKTGYITDQFGNVKGKSTTIEMGDYSETHVRDNMGNSIIDSTTLGNYTNTKIRKH